MVMFLQINFVLIIGNFLGVLMVFEHHHFWLMFVHHHVCVFDGDILSCIWFKPSSSLSSLLTSCLDQYCSLLQHHFEFFLFFHHEPWKTAFCIGYYDACHVCSLLLWFFISSITVDSWGRHYTLLRQTWMLKPSKWIKSLHFYKILCLVLHSLSCWVTGYCHILNTTTYFQLFMVFLIDPFCKAHSLT